MWSALCVVYSIRLFRRLLPGRERAMPTMIWSGAPSQKGDSLCDCLRAFDCHVGWSPTVRPEQNDQLKPRAGERSRNQGGVSQICADDSLLIVPTHQPITLNKEKTSTQQQGRCSEREIGVIGRIWMLIWWLYVFLLFEVGSNNRLIFLTIYIKLMV